MNFNQVILLFVSAVVVSAQSDNSNANVNVNANTNADTNANANANPNPNVNAYNNNPNANANPNNAINNNPNVNVGDGQVHDTQKSYRKDRRQDIKAKANATGYSAADLPQSVQDNLAARSANFEQFRASVSADAAAHGYSEGYSAIPTSVRRAYMSSVAAANSGKFKEMRESASAFMATQTKINSESLAQMKATAKSKRKNIFQRQRKATGTLNNAFPSPTASSLNSGFKNFFKNIQMKIHSSNSSSAVFEAASSVAGEVSATLSAASAAAYEASITPTPVA